MIEWEDDEEVPAQPSYPDPAWLKPKRRINLEDGTTYRWFRVVYRPWDTSDLSIQMLGPQDNPPWYSDEPLSEVLVAHLEQDEMRIAKWALEEGLCPGQFFLVCFAPPTISGGGPTWYDTDGDYEIDYNWQIVRKMPVRPDSALRAWERFLARVAEWDRLSQRREAHRRRVLSQQTSRWKIAQKGAFKIELQHCPKKSRQMEGTVVVSGGNCKELIQNLKKEYPEAPVQPLLVLLAKDMNLSRLDFLLLDDAEHHPEGGPVHEALL